MASWCQGCIPSMLVNEVPALIDGMPEPPPFESDRKIVELTSCTAVRVPPDEDLQHLEELSRQFRAEFPVETVRTCDLQVEKQVLEHNANSAYPVLHECTLHLLSDFLDHKRQYGTNVERKLYSDMGILDLVQRLLDKRAVYFLSRKDYYELRNGRNGCGGWEAVGTDDETPPLVLKDCLSYDEIKLSALLGVSSRSVFINDGSRSNRGVVSSLKSKNFQHVGVIMGLIGPRLEKHNVMEWQEIVITKEQNKKENGYGTYSREESNNALYLWRRIWARFYGIVPNFPTYEEAVKSIKEPSMSRRFLRLSDDEFFDDLAYQKRMAVSFETLLLEAEHRARFARKMAYIHVVGLGLGTWVVDKQLQERGFLEAFASCLKKLDGALPNISDIRFSYFERNTCGGVGDGGKTSGEIHIHFSKDAPHCLPKGESEGKLLVVTFASDGNALPGNAFWCGDLCSSSDTAAACSTQIAELHNPLINPSKVCSANLHVASPQWGVLHIAEYARKQMEDHPQCRTLLGVDCVKNLLFQIHSDDAYEPVGRCAPISGMPRVATLDPESETYVLLQACLDTPKSSNVTLKELLQYSSTFPRKFGVESVRCKDLLEAPGIPEDQLTFNANSVYPLLHECALFLFCDFLLYKRKHGSEIERALYANMSLIQLVHRLLEKRAVSFTGGADRYMLVDGEKGIGGWDAVGTETESQPLVLEKCLSYDEMKLSALLSVSSHTVFLNDGRRKNRGVLAKPEEIIEKNGVIVGLIGPRLVRDGVNEFQEVLVTQDQNTKKNGYGSAPQGTLEDAKYQWRMVWARFYGTESNLPSYDDAVKNYRASKRRVYQRFTELSDRELFDNMVYQKRIAVSAETLLLEAEHRAASAGKTAYVHVVGIGLGVWRTALHQEKEFLDAFASCLKKLSSKLQHVSDVRFGWFKETLCGGVPDGGTIAGHIRLHFSSEAPHRLLTGDDEGKLLVVSYAWDGNALPGNEFWWGELGTSGDPAAACSTQVAELHNPHVNPTKVCGTNLHVASPLWGVHHISEYVKRKLGESPKDSPD